MLYTCTTKASRNLTKPLAEPPLTHYFMYMHIHYYTMYIYLTTIKFSHYMIFTLLQSPPSKSWYGWTLLKYRNIQTGRRTDDSDTLKCHRPFWHIGQKSLCGLLVPSTALLEDQSSWSKFNSSNLGLGCLSYSPAKSTATGPHTYCLGLHVSCLPFPCEPVCSKEGGMAYNAGYWSGK